MTVALNSLSVKSEDLTPTSPPSKSLPIHFSASRYCPLLLLPSIFFSLSLSCVLFTEWISVLSDILIFQHSCLLSVLGEPTVCQALLQPWGSLMYKVKTPVFVELTF